MDALVFTEWLIELESSLPLPILIHRKFRGRDKFAVLVHPHFVSARTVFAIDVDLEHSRPTVRAHNDLPLGLRCVITR
jgi:hypothetical protein